ncbi:hypothetical protein [Anaerophilus nitritogenes]|uniref:hypothetical protein n=1 Tax=Anaerophilus nitritogenes TaxID=2498136 RepID=UPI00101CE0A4|nr:hypothetical protein [Anaerophilus nitritogenes]
MKITANCVPIKVSETLKIITIAGQELGDLLLKAIPETSSYEGKHCSISIEINPVDESIDIEGVPQNIDSDGKEEEPKCI